MALLHAKERLVIGPLVAHVPVFPQYASDEIVAISLLIVLHALEYRLVWHSRLALAFHQYEDESFVAVVAVFDHFDVVDFVLEL